MAVLGGVLLAGCGTSAADGNDPRPDDPVAAARALAGADTPIASCAGLTEPGAPGAEGAEPAILGRDSAPSGGAVGVGARPRMRESGTTDISEARPTTADGALGPEPEPGGQLLPDLTLDCLGEGGPVSLRELRGPAVVNIWASWCGPCVDELPHLLAARDALTGDVTVLGIAISDRAGHSRDWMSFNGATYPSLQDPAGSVRGPLRVPGPPVTVFLDSAGRIAKVHYGAFTSAEQILDAVDQHLGRAA